MASDNSSGMFRVPFTISDHNRHSSFVNAYTDFPATVCWWGTTTVRPRAVLYTTEEPDRLEGEFMSDQHGFLKCAIADRTANPSELVIFYIAVSAPGRSRVKVLTINEADLHHSDLPEWCDQAASSTAYVYRRQNKTFSITAEISDERPPKATFHIREVVYQTGVAA